MDRKHTTVQGFHRSREGGTVPRPAADEDQLHLSRNGAPVGSAFRLAAIG